MMEERAGMSRSSIGIVEALALSLSFLVQIFSGRLSDYAWGRKRFIFFGSFLSFFAKILMALWLTPFGLAFGRVVDRLSKGVRSAPVDAALVDNSSLALLSEAFGWRQCLYTLGAVLGSIFAMWAMKYSAFSFEEMILIASVPTGCASLAVVLFFREDSSALVTSQQMTTSSRVLGATFCQQMQDKFWMFGSAIFFLFLGRFSEAFIALHLRDLGIPHAFLPLIFIFSGLVHVFACIPSGRWAVRYSPHRVACWGAVTQCLALLAFYIATTWQQALCACCLTGFSLALTQNTTRALVGSAAGSRVRGKAFAHFYLICGVATLLSNTLVGRVAQQTSGVSQAFLLGMFSSLASVAFLYKWGRRVGGMGGSPVTKIPVTVKRDV